MNKAELIGYLKEQVHTSALRISPKVTKSDRIDAARITLLISLLNVLCGSASPEDLGHVGAINDVLQALGVVGESETLLSGLTP